MIKLVIRKTKIRTPKGEELWTPLNEFDIPLFLHMAGGTDVGIPTSSLTSFVTVAKLHNVEVQFQDLKE